MIRANTIRESSVKLCESSVELRKWSYAQTKVSNCHLTLTPKQTLIQWTQSGYIYKQQFVQRQPSK